eukprot:2465851-Pyramimonas_sp.AAC.1
MCKVCAKYVRVSTRDLGFDRIGRCLHLYDDVVTGWYLVRMVADGAHGERLWCGLGGAFKALAVALDVHCHLPEVAFGSAFHERDVCGQAQPVHVLTCGQIV